MNCVHLVFKIISTVLLVIYPIAVYFGLKYQSLFVLVPCLIIVFFFRMITMKTNIKEWLWIMRLISLIAIGLLIMALVMKSVAWVLYYPVLVNIVMLSVFSYSLHHPPTIIERFARLHEPNLPEEGVAYTRAVTKIWCVFFVINGTISMITTQLIIEYWTLYNGLISYVLMGTLMLGEFLYRKRVIKTV